MLLEIVIKSKRNSWNLNCPTGPYQHKFQILFQKKSPPQDFFKGQLISEWLFDVLNFPKNQRKNLMNFCPRI